MHIWHTIVDKISKICILMLVIKLFRSITMKKVRFLLAAGILLALAFTISCSDDDKSGGWLTCQDFVDHINKCDRESEAEWIACSDDACRDAAEAKFDKCKMNGACNGTSWEECIAHYEESCPNM